MQKETEIKLRVSRATLEALQEHPLLKKRNKSGWERRELYNQYYDTPAASWPEPRSRCACAATASSTSRR